MGKLFFKMGYKKLITGATIRLRLILMLQNKNHDLAHRGMSYAKINVNQQQVIHPLLYQLALAS